jgi:hypothetical protein
MISYRSSSSSSSRPRKDIVARGNLGQPSGGWAVLRPKPENRGVDSLTAAPREIRNRLHVFRDEQALFQEQVRAYQQGVGPEGGDAVVGGVPVRGVGRVERRARLGTATDLELFCCVGLYPFWLGRRRVRQTPGVITVTLCGNSDAC